MPHVLMCIQMVQGSGGNASSESGGWGVPEILHIRQVPGLGAKCGPWMVMPWEPVRPSESQAPPRTYESESAF